MPSRRTEADLREPYLRWLEEQLGTGGRRTYWDLTNLMFDMEFTWSVPMDDNRLVDARDLRTEFATGVGVPISHVQDLAPVSFLEILIVLSRKLTFVAGGSAPGWAYVLLGNLELRRMFDPLTQRKAQRAQEIMQTVIQRKYMPDGTGGFFPLAWPDGDQTTIELWYQLNAYVEELHPEH